MFARVFITSCFVALSFGSFAHGGLEQVFRVDGGDPNNSSPVGMTLQVTYSNLVADGVTFDARLTVTGSSTLSQSGSGLGVTDSDLDDGESLSFSMFVFNETGGTVTFDGFNRVAFIGYDPVVEIARIQPGNEIAGNPGNLPLLDTFSVTSESNPSTTHLSEFTVDSTRGQFTGVASVPEPSPWLFLSLCVCMVAGKKYLPGGIGRH